MSEVEMIPAKKRKSVDEVLAEAAEAVERAAAENRKRYRELLVRNELSDEEADELNRLVLTLGKTTAEEVAKDRQMILQVDRLRAERAKFDPVELGRQRRELRTVWDGKAKELREAVEAERKALGEFKAVEMKLDRWDEMGVRLTKLESSLPDLFE